jgi:hypothetical protein
MNQKLKPRKNILQTNPEEWEVKDITSLLKHSKTIKKEIHRLECTIAAAPELKLRQAIEKKDFLPIEQDYYYPERSRQRKPLQVAQQENKQKIFLWIELLIALSCLLALTGWLRQWLQF